MTCIFLLEVDEVIVQTYLTRTAARLAGEPLGRARVSGFTVRAVRWSPLNGALEKLFVHGDGFCAVPGVSVRRYYLSPWPQLQET